MAKAIYGGFIGAYPLQQVLSPYPSLMESIGQRDASSPCLTFAPQAQSRDKPGIV